MNNKSIEKSKPYATRFFAVIISNNFNYRSPVKQILILSALLLSIHLLPSKRFDYQWHISAESSGCIETFLNIFYRLRSCPLTMIKLITNVRMQARRCLSGVSGTTSGAIYSNQVQGICCRGQWRFTPLRELHRPLKLKVPYLEQGMNNRWQQLVFVIRFIAQRLSA